MTRPQLRLLGLFLALPFVIALAAFLYQLGMVHLEGVDRSFLDGLTWAAESLSTTGYGGDSHWKSPWMVLLVIVVQFGGVFLVFLVFPIYLIPFLEERFEPRVPTEATGLSDHVIIYGASSRVETLLAETDREGIETLIVTSDLATARRLAESKRRVVLGTVDDGVVDRISLQRARALVVDGSDNENAAVTVGARQAGFEGTIVALVEDPLHRRPLTLAGATAAFTPRHILGAALAARASDRISPTVSGLQQLGKHLQIAEFHVRPTSILVGKTLSESEIGRRTGSTVIGRWRGGTLQAQLPPESDLASGDILLVAGTPGNIEKLSELCGDMHRLPHQGPFVIGGAGEVGRKVVELLGDAGEPTHLIDRLPAAGVDQVGDVLDPSTLHQAPLQEARAVILALDSDSATLFATVIVRDLAPTVPIFVRVNQARNVEQMYRVGATYALALSEVVGQMLARRLLGSESIFVNPALRVEKISARPLAGRGVTELDIRPRTGCSFVAVERQDELLVDLSGDFRFAEDDDVFIVGSDEATQRFGREFPQPDRSEVSHRAAL